MAGDGRAWTETVDHPVASVAAADGRVYVGTDGGRIVAFDGESGAERWSKSLPVPTDPSKATCRQSVRDTAASQSTGGPARSPNSSVYAPDGSELRDQPRQRSLNGRPHVRGDTVYARSEFLRAFNRDSGAPRWVNRGSTIRMAVAVQP